MLRTRRRFCSRRSKARRAGASSTRVGHGRRHRGQDALRSILAVMAADGQITAIGLTDADALQAEDAGWVDGEAPLILRAAPKEARTMRDRITEALVGAGWTGWKRTPCMTC